MEFEELKHAHRRVNALARITTRARVLQDGHVILSPPGQTIAVKAWPDRAIIHVRNVGGTAQEIASLSSVPGVRVVGVPPALHLPARMRAAVPLSLEIDPVALAPEARDVPLHFELVGPARGSPEQKTVHLTLSRPAGAEVAVTAQEIAFEVEALNAHLFQIVAPGASRAVLHIEKGPGGARHHDMARLDERTFQVGVLTEPGAQYAYRFLVDSSFRTDPRSPASVDVLNVSTPCSILDTDSLTRPLGIRNLGRQTLTIAGAPGDDALKVSPAQLRLGPLQEGLFTCGLAKMPAAGAHATNLVLQWKGAKAATLKLPVRITVTAPGPLPEVPRTLDFGGVLAGAESSPVVVVRNVGSGTLRGRIESAGAIHGASFSVEAGQAAQVPLTLRVPDTPGAANQTVQVRLQVTSETLLADRQRIDVDVRYVVQAMVLEPAAIAFQVAAGTVEKKTLRIRLPGEAKPEGLAVSDSKLPAWLALDSSKPGVLEVAIDGAAWTGVGDEKIDLAVKLRHRRTGATATLKIAGEFLVPRLEVEPRVVSFDRVARSAPPTAPVLLRNTGRGTLVVQRITLDHEWLTVEPQPAAKGDDVQLMVGVRPEKMTRGRHRGCVELLTNDRSGNQRVTIDVRAKVFD